MRARFTAVGLALVVALGVAGTAQATITISGPTTVAEPATGTVSASYTVTRSGLTLDTATVTVATTNLTAVSPGDYTGGTQAVNLGPGLLGDSKTVTIPIAADALDEDPETFKVSLTATTTDAIDPAASTVTTTITDNAADLPPTVSAGPASVTEGTAAAASVLAVPVVLSAVSGRAVTVGYATTDGTATAGSDYTATTGTLTIPAGQAGAAINVPVAADALDEDDETLTVTLSSPVNATLQAPAATGTITDDDTATITVTGATVLEGAAGATTATNALVNLSVASTRAVTVSYATGDGTAVAPGDYIAASGQVTVPPGQRTVLIPLSIVGDSTIEPDEAFTVTLAGPIGAAIATSGAGAPVVIRNDDGPGAGIIVPPGQLGTVVTKPSSTGGLPGTNGGTTKGVALGKLKFDRATGRMSFVITCPAGLGRCKGTVTVFSIPSAKSKVKALRHEQQLATKTFDLVQGAKATAALRLSARARGWLRSARLVKITAYAVCRDAKGAYSTAKVAGTLKR
ncbi:MAG: endoglucanase [Solirubrobacterales bacterium]|nr:endoglucanase [Solirubrobacterales bacterium]